MLPGMDGTGELFDPIINLLPDSINRKVIPLSSLYSDNTKSQADEIAEKLGNGNYIIFAESYSGTIAYNLCQDSRLNIKGVVFAASFLSRPSFISKFGYMLPISILRYNMVPKFFLSWLLFGTLNRIELVKLFLTNLKLVSNKTLKSRLRNISTLSEPKIISETTCTYIQASNDLLVSKKAILPFKKLFKDLRIEQAKGGHFIALCNPQKCVEVINAHFRR